MAKSLLDDKLVEHRTALNVILFVLKSGIAWGDVPSEMGCSGVTAWRRLDEWQKQGVWNRLHRVLLNRLSSEGHIDWSRAVIDGSSVPAPKGGPDGPEPDGSGEGRH